MKKTSLFVLLTTAAWAAVCFLKVHQAVDPSGGDGYFYLKQTEWLFQNYQFYHSDYSFIFFPLAALYAITGSSLLAFQIVTSVSLFLISSAVGLIFYQSLEQMKDPWSEWKRVLLSCFFVLVFAMQGSTLKLGYEFAKNGLAQGLLLWAVLLYFLDRRKTSLLLLLLGSFTHKLAALFFVLVLLVMFFRKNRPSWSFIAIGSLVGLIGIFFSRLPKHIQNLIEKFSFEKSFVFQADNMLLNRFLIALVLLWLIVAAIQYRKVKNPLLLAMIVFSFIPFLPVFGGSNIEIKYRLLLISFTFAAAAFVWIWPTIKTEYPRRILMLISLTILTYQAFQDTGFPWIANWSERIKNLDQLQERVDPKDELVTQHGLQFYIDYKTKIRARSMVSSQRKPVYQIGYNPEFYHLNPTLSDEIRQLEMISLGESYSLFEYDAFQKLIRKYPMLADWRNQFQVRPEFVQDY